MKDDKKISPQKVKHIAHLARIGLSEQEVIKFQGQLEAIINYMEILNEVDTSGVEPTTQVTGLKNVMREDKVGDKAAISSELLKCSPLSKINNQISVKAIIKE